MKKHTKKTYKNTLIKIKKHTNITGIWQTFRKICPPYFSTHTHTRTHTPSEKYVHHIFPTQHAHTHTRTHAQMHKCTHAHWPSPHTRTHTHMLTHMHTHARTHLSKNMSTIFFRHTRCWHTHTHSEKYVRHIFPTQHHTNTHTTTLHHTHTHTPTHAHHNTTQQHTHMYTHNTHTLTQTHSLFKPHTKFGRENSLCENSQCDLLKMRNMAAMKKYVWHILLLPSSKFASQRSRPFFRQKEWTLGLQILEKVGVKIFFTLWCFVCIVFK